MPKGQFVGTEACHFCPDGQIGWFETGKSAPAHPKLWGYCGGNPEGDRPGCGTRIYLGAQASRERYRAADQPAPVSPIEPEEPKNANIQTSEPEPAGDLEPVAEPEPDDDISFFPTG